MTLLFVCTIKISGKVARQMRHISPCQNSQDKPPKQVKARVKAYSFIYTMRRHVEDVLRVELPDLGQYALNRAWPLQQLNMGPVFRNPSSSITSASHLTIPSSQRSNSPPFSDVDSEEIRDLLSNFLNWVDLPLLIPAVIPEPQTHLPSASTNTHDDGGKMMVDTSYL